MNLRNFKFISVLSIVYAFSGLSNAQEVPSGIAGDYEDSRHKKVRVESITRSTYDTFKISARPHPKHVETRDMSASDFDRVFPIPQSISYYCGRINMEFGCCCTKKRYVGSGVLIREPQGPDDKEFVGITAKHVLFDSERWIFSRKAKNPIFHIAQHNGIDSGEILIKRFIPHDDFDICLFYGELRRRVTDTRPIAATIPRISLTYPTLNQAFTINHYPDGDDRQRINGGVLNKVSGNNGDHTADTYGGSSGAPLFSPTGEIIGIHTAGNNISSLAIQDERRRDIAHPSTENSCVLINKDFIDKLMDTRDYSYIR